MKFISRNAARKNRNAKKQHGLRKAKKKRDRILFAIHAPWYIKLFNLIGRFIHVR
jgi:endonuclease IV